MRVLLVEDEHRISAYVKRGLEEQGYAVDVAYTGREALDWAAVVEFDLIVLDVLLPQVNGLTVCRELRSKNVRTPILMLTARDSVDDRVAGLDAGADDYLVKPFAIKELLARLRALARRAGDVPKMTVLQVGDLTLDVRTHRVVRGDKPIELSPKEFAVLECLMREPSRVLSRTVIAEHVWNYETYNDSNVVDVYVRNLRRKLDEAYELKLIRTVRGAGYSISADQDEAN
ncbi:MAG: response regulator transcription factor [Anaerolineae bacterium]|nr:response regulator transcription factor [Anaerolineae bacterium]